MNNDQSPLDYARGRIARLMEEKAGAEAYAASLFAAKVEAEQRAFELAARCSELERQLGFSAIPSVPAATYPACKGMNCGATDGVSHSMECQAEHAASIAGGYFVKATTAPVVGGDRSNTIYTTEFQRLLETWWHAKETSAVTLAHVDLVNYIDAHTGEAVVQAVSGERDRCAKLATQWGMARSPDGGGNALFNFAEAVRLGVPVDERDTDYHWSKSPIARADALRERAEKAEQALKDKTAIQQAAQQYVLALNDPHTSRAGEERWLIQLEAALADSNAAEKALQVDTSSVAFRVSLPAGTSGVISVRNLDKFPNEGAQALQQISDFGQLQDGPDHGETVLRVQAALGCTDTGWISPDVILMRIEQLKDKAATAEQAQASAPIPFGYVATRSHAETGTVFNTSRIMEERYAKACASQWRSETRTYRVDVLPVFITHSQQQGAELAKVYGLPNKPALSAPSPVMAYAADLTRDQLVTALDAQGALTEVYRDIAMDAARKCAEPTKTEGCAGFQGKAVADCGPCGGAGCDGELPPLSDALWRLVDSYANAYAEYQYSTERHLAKQQRENVADAKAVLTSAILATRQPAPADLIGLAVSVDVSTGDDDATHRYFGKVDTVQACEGEKGGIILLVQEPKPNFAAPVAAAVAQGEVLEELARAACKMAGYTLPLAETLTEFKRIAAAQPTADAAPVDAKPDYAALGANLRIEQTDVGRWVVCVENWYPDDESARAACRKWIARYSEAPPIMAMVNRFLGWRLPQDFGPDCGISFDGRKDDEWNKNKSWPIGTNLLTADQAKAMFEYCLAVQPSPVQGDALADAFAIATAGPQMENGNWPKDFNDIIKNAEVVAHQQGRAAGIAEAKKDDHE